MFGPDGGSKCSQASCLYGPWWAAKHTPHLPHCHYNCCSAAADTHTRDEDTGIICISTQCRPTYALILNTHMHTHRGKGQQRTIGPSDNGARRNALLHINIQQSGCRESVCQQGGMLINLTNTGVRQPHDYKVLRLWSPAPQLLIPSSYSLTS